MTIIAISVPIESTPGPGSTARATVAMKLEGRQWLATGGKALPMVRVAGFDRCARVVLRELIATGETRAEPFA